MERDQVSISTPEGLTLRMPLAGVGSRSIAGSIDFTIIILTALFLEWVNATGPLRSLQPVVLTMLGIMAFTGYFLLFELFSNGQTPGKRIMRIRVLRSDGGPTTFTATLIRNLMRYVDFLPYFYGIAIGTIFASSKNQRLGDMAAGTIVTQDLRSSEPAGQVVTSVFAEAPEHLHAWDVTNVQPEDVAVIAQFLDRRYEINPETRASLARQLRVRVEPRILTDGQPRGDEQILTYIVNLKNAR